VGDKLGDEVGQAPATVEVVVVAVAFVATEAGH
jgi:hypothetical protein